jgi:DNA-binding GntR family transcriptional regulator
MAGIDELSALEGRPTSELIADQLRDRILEGAFRPGEQVIEAQLAARLRVSRGPVREALQRLSQEGLLVSHRNRGVFVLELTATDIAEIYVARKATETAAAETVLASGKAKIVATAQVLRQIVQEMSAAMNAGEWPRLAERDLAFHRALVEASGNSRLSRIYATLAAESRICMVNLEGSYRRVDVLVEEHQRIVELLAEERGEALLQEIAQHMDKAVADLSASMNRQMS